MTGSRFYLTTSEKSLFEQQFYRMPVNGGAGAREQITSMVGWHDADVSPDGKMIADVYSYANQPPELFAIEVGRARRRRRSPRVPRRSGSRHKWLVPEIVWITASDGVKVPARIYRPRTWAPSRTARR